MNYNFRRIKDCLDSEAGEELKLFFSSNETALLRYYEPDLGLFVVESPMVIERALRAGYVPRSFVMIDSVAEEMCQSFEKIMEDAGKGDSGDSDEIDEQTDSGDKEGINEKAELGEVSGDDKKSDVTENDDNITVYIDDYDTIAELTGVNISRGVLAMFRRETLPQISEVLQDCRRIAVFDDVENPTNIGAMFRSAAALGIEAVILTGNSSDPLYRRASRVSVGTVFQIPWTRLGNKKNDVNYIDILNSLGFKTVAMALSDNSISIRDECLKKEEKLAIILGNEGYGLSDEVISSSDYVVKIPMKNNVDSLNVAAASSVVFWELCG